ncbi:MAG TPA: type II toxin-antitoxin system PemK/MazF family toxin [Thermodesulfobacteriota bacterium]|nr:type II toxin-antitoxin system PemK/MazF family toxin [Thermodesulfobacteriota bacterium]
MMVNPGDVVTVDFPGALGVKRRPAVVVSTQTYHTTRPDVVLCLLTSQTAGATGPTDYILQDWSSAGLHSPSALRAFLATLPATSIIVIGHLSDRDWQEVQERLRIALAVT